MGVADAGECRKIGEYGDYAHGCHYDQSRGDEVGRVIGTLSVDAGAEQGKSCDYHAFGTLHEAYLAFQTQTFGPGANVADHDGACKSQKGQQGAEEVAYAYQPVGYAAQCEQLAVAVKHGVVHGAESRCHSSEACDLSVEHVEKREPDYQSAGEGHAAVVGPPPPVS